MCGNCQGQGHVVGGFVVDVLVGKDTIPFCSLRDKSDVRHTVVVHSLVLFPLRIECEGSTASKNKKIEFLLPTARNTWTGYIILPPPSQRGEPITYKFSPVKLHKIHNATGDEIINTVVEAKRAGRIYPPTQVSINIDVSKLR